ncbi:hypothetical protein [Candidatus Mycobacterium methanotrophicum]|uniref:Transmembrane protein n=1 Tax=Candidatus Mycobacterium methanotrophicum TaxID=2943498 RepID=A0ABY4QJ11_9MYCO|nr:hypothetical protein [Candidatus Mycobacterium methanotrophicum]UQX10844.1 hypothetical protein M5I08_23310 [Candidatus Mycobacterium methanotrophicum]
MRHWVARWSRPGYALALAVLVVVPLIGPGYLLLRDAVSTPRSYLSDSALGLMSAPRATPQDFAVALASHFVDGGLVVKALLVAGLWLAGWGAARLVALVLPEAGAGGQFVAITLAIWNPYVAERLLQGHWSLLLGYGCLPWVATTMLTLRSGSTGFFGLAFWIALAGLTPTGLILAATVALVCAAVPVGGAGGSRPRWVCAAAALAGALLAALPWLTAAALGLSSADRIWVQAPDVAAFAARAEPGLGTLGSLASLGGIWNSEAVPPSRTTLFAMVSAGALLGVVAIGLPTVLRRRAAVPLIALAAVSVLAPAALATGPGLATLQAAVDAAPGVGVLRDGQKWVALAMPGYALAGAGAVLTLRRFSGPAVPALVCCAALLLTLPDLAWGVGGRVAPVNYPAGWAAVAALINRDPGLVAVLPVDTMRRFAWSRPAPVLDPLPRWVRSDVLITGDLIVSGVTVLGEGHRARKVQRLLLAGADPAALRNAGVAWLVVEAGTTGDMGWAARTFERLPVVYRGHDLTLYRVNGQAGAVPADRRLLAVIAHLVWLEMLIVGATGMAVAGWRQAEMA